MRIAMINASPKMGEGSSRTLLGKLDGLLVSERVSIELHRNELNEEQLAEMNGCDAWVIAFPLYIDAIPSHLLRCMRQIENNAREKKVCVYAVVNCGFYEGRQARQALAVMKNWCSRTGLEWCMGVGFGGGGGLELMGGVPLGAGPMKSLGGVFDTLAKAIENGSSADDALISIDFPRCLYKIGAEMMWRKIGKANGLKKKDLNRRL